MPPLRRKPVPGRMVGPYGPVNPAGFANEVNNPRPFRPAPMPPTTRGVGPQGVPFQGGGFNPPGHAYGVDRPRPKPIEPIRPIGPPMQAHPFEEGLAEQHAALIAQQQLAQQQTRRAEDHATQREKMKYLQALFGG